MTLLKGLGHVETRPQRCDSHGDYDSILVTIGQSRWTGCPVCARNAIARQDDAARGDEEAARRREQGQALARVAGIPLRHAESNFERFNVMPDSGEEQALEKIYAYANGEGLMAGEGLVLCGKAGTGKTHLACALVQHATRERLLAARYTTAADIFRRVRAMYTNRDETEGAIIEEMAAPSLLVIDEVGMGRGSEHDAQIIRDVLFRRYDDMTATVLVTNLTFSQLFTWLGDRVHDRLRDTATGVVFNWTSHRGDN